MSQIVAKRVTMWELFYDLIFVYAISRMTHMIHHLHKGIISWTDYGLFALVCIIIMQAWMYQTTYINKYGQGRLTDLLGLGINMLGAIYVAVSINTTWEETFFSFNIGMLLMHLAICFQFWFAKKDKEISNKEKGEIKTFLSLIAISSSLIVLGLLLGYQPGIYLVVFAYLFQAYAPLFMKERFLGATLNFPHLVERTGLITIILFGESIVGLTSLFTASSNPLIPILIFISVVFMFATYQVQTEEMLDHSADSNGIFLMHLHLILPIGLLTVTAGWGYLLDSTVRKDFLTLFLLLGMGVYYLSLFATSRYNKPKFSLTKGDVGHYLGSFILAGGLAFICKEQPVAFVAGFTFLTFAMMIKGLLKVKKQNS